MECVTKALLSNKECEVGSLSKVYPDSIIKRVQIFFWFFEKNSGFFNNHYNITTTTN